MRAIKKGAFGGHHLSQAHAKPPTTPTQATSRWDSFAHKPKLMQFLLREQYQLCCYSEVRADLLGIGYHIEHVENKSLKPTRTFDYDNLAASALCSEALSKIQAFGGHAAGKQNAVDMAKFISCHRADCAKFFVYLSDGRIVPSLDLKAAEQARAQYTIDLLNLNSSYLLPLRQAWWHELELLFEEHNTKNWSLNDLIALDLVPHQDTLSQFFSLTRQFFGVRAEQVLLQKAPMLL
jgi:uncharacterized protein (TIGR02646 family)